MTYHLAIDIGASSGRHILGYIDNGKLKLEKIYRFENYIKNENGTLVWDIKHLVESVIFGIAKCREIGKIPKTVAIDTWGVDYVLLDKDKKEILPAVSYRDGRTNAVTDIISQKELYSKTGIQKQNFNTIYQLYCDKLSGKLDNAEHFLMIPDYLSFKLTGIIKNEYTNATTTNLVNAKTKTWDAEILDKLGIKNIFCDLSMSKTVIGNFTDEIKKQVGFDTTVIYCPSHDTASAVAACPIEYNSVYISSGTWSLIGTENTEPVLTADALTANFTNEGGINYRFRFLKNIMGMWIFQNIRRNINKSLTYDEIMELAMAQEGYAYFDVNDSSIVAPSNMVEAIGKLIGSNDLGFVINSAYHSLAQSYADAVNEIEAISEKTIDTINIVGGGSKDSYLNRLTKEYTGKRVLAGPVEATATGNIICQLMYADDNLTLEKARELVKNSFDIKEVE
ncbi:rhamnulokinase family protein [uncultured Eubacterium sp.]|uniref:rhamnulokinase n=1 Tax=uncultured Eubacterium sp. TaxID=165185 RepID=UPI0015BE111B|nr:rhamnulokinase family protein [uncultured Eubacterium sp.]